MKNNQAVARLMLGFSEHPELADKGGLQKAWGLFGKDLDGLMDEMNMELVA